MERIVNAGPIAVSAALLLLAFPPFNLGFLVFAALVPWLLSLREANPKQGFRSGITFGILYMGGQFVFLVQFVERWTGSLPLALIPAVLAALISSLFFGAVGTLIATCWSRGWVWAIPFVWTGMELVRSFLPGLEFPWGLIHTPLWPYPYLIQLAWFGTAYLISIALVMANVVIALMMLKEPFSKIRPLLIPTAVLFVGASMRAGAPMSGEAAYISVGQPAVDMAYTPEPQQTQQVGEAVSWIIERARAHESRLLVLPEGLVNAGDGLPPATPFQVPTDMTILFGGARGSDKVYQAAYGFDGKWSYADKRRLVVFGEYVPFRNQLPFLQHFNMPAGDISPGRTTEALTLGGIKVGPLICFEGLFADVAYDQVRNGAQLLTVMSIDDWYLGSNAPDQLAAASVFRAIESGLPLVRSASLGHTLAVDPRGNVIARARLKERDVLRVDVLIPEKPDTFAGIWIAPLIALLSVVLVPLAAWRFRAPASP